MFYLRNYTNASCDRSINTVPKMVESLLGLGYNIIGICDYEIITNFVVFKKQIDKYKNFVGIYSVEIKLNDLRLVLVVKNIKGYNNLCRLLSRYHLNNEETLEGNLSGIGFIILNLAEQIQLGLYNITSIINKIRERNKGKIYYELNLLHYPIKDYLNTEVLKFIEDFDLYSIATFPNFYTLKENKSVYKVFMAIRDNKVSIIDIDLPDRHAFTKEEIERAYIDDMDAINNLYSLYLQINFNLETIPGSLPVLITKSRYIKRIFKAYQKLNKNNEYDNSVYLPRLREELNTICNFHFENYFMIFDQIINFCLEAKIIYNIRGSASGSLVLYLMRITNLDPVFYRLSFERFLNKGRLKRNSLPDIDVDISSNSRDLVIEFLKKKYPKYVVCHVLTYLKATAKATLRDVSRVHGLSFFKTNILTRFVSSNIVDKTINTISNAMELPQLIEMYNSDPIIKNIVDDSLQLENLIRGYSQHAAGLVLMNEMNQNYIPLLKLGDNLVTMYDMRDMESLGAVKLDLLGLITLDIIKYTLKTIKLNRGIDVNIYQNQPDSLWESVKRCSVNGLFQIDTNLLSAMVRALNVQNLYQMADIISLVRPGAFSFLETYKENKETGIISYLFEGKYKALNEILEETSGVILYQEQVQNIAMKVANFDPVEADNLRYAVGKKNIEMMNILEYKFKENSIKYSHLTKEDADTLWNLIHSWCGYGFNLSHALSYAKITEATLFLKTKYSIEFILALLRYRWNKEGKMVNIISDMWYHNIEYEIIGVDSEYENCIKGDKIHFGWEMYKGKEVINKDILYIIDLMKNSEIDDFYSFYKRAQLNEAQLEELIKSNIFRKWISIQEALNYLKNTEGVNLLFNIEHNTDLELTMSELAEVTSREVELYGTIRNYEVYFYNIERGYGTIFEIALTHYFEESIILEIALTIIKLEFVQRKFSQSKEDEKELMVVLTDSSHTITIYVKETNIISELLNAGLFSNILVTFRVITLFNNKGNSLRILRLKHLENEIQPYYKTYLKR